MKVVDLFGKIRVSFPEAVVADGGIELNVRGLMVRHLHSIYGEFARSEEVRGQIRVTRSGDVRVTDGERWMLFEFDSAGSLLQWIADAAKLRDGGFQITFPDESSRSGWVDSEGRFVS